jgi:outer membrane biosynthesis protein TonB
VLSRGTREAVFIALRLSLAAAYARRGVMLPLILDDVLVNFDGDRALHAADTLRTFAELGHQVMMFTCHEHIADIFHSIGVEVRGLPAQGRPGRAMILPPPEAELEYEEEDYFEDEPQYEDEPVVEEEQPPVAEVPEPEPEPQPEPQPAPELKPKPQPEPQPEPVVIVKEKPAPPPKVIVVEKPAPKPAPPKPAPSPKPARPVVTVAVDAEPNDFDDELLDSEPEDHAADRHPIGWAWFQREPADGRVDADERSAEQLATSYRSGDEADFAAPHDGESIPDEVWDRSDSWWDGSRVAS